MGHLGHDDMDGDPGFFLQFMQEVHGGKLVQGKIRGFLGRDAVHGNLEDLPGGAVGVVHRVHDDELVGSILAQGQIKEDLPDAGAHVPDQNVGRQIIVLLEMLHHRGPETVIPEEDVAAAENQDGF